MRKKLKNVDNISKNEYNITIREYYIGVYKMLVELSCKNYKSFKNENTLYMEATSIKEHEHNLIKYEGKKYIKIAAIYGANASGKSNLLKAYDFMRTNVLEGTIENSDQLKYNKFIFSKETKKQPIELEVVFIRNENKYKYGFSLNDNGIVAEWLYIKGKKGYKPIFDRDNNVIKIGSTFKDLKKYNKTSVVDNALFLSTVIKFEWNNIDLKNVYEFFLSTKYINLSDVDFEQKSMEQLAEGLEKDSKLRENINQFISSIDVGIQELEVIKSKEKNTKKIINCMSLHKSDTKSNEYLPLLLESSGTKKMLSVYYYLYFVLKQGDTVLVDELDAKLHPLLTRYILNMFHNKKTNPYNAQLIYSTHDTVNLNKDTFRRDEIWFTEKDVYGVSTIYSLADYAISNIKVRNDATYNKDYLSGRYGAIPIIKEFEITEYEE